MSEEQIQPVSKPHGFARLSPERRREIARMAVQKHPVRGFSLMTPERRREVASRGGKRAHQVGTAHRWTPEEAAEAGRKGGKMSRTNGVSQEHLA